VCLGGVFVGALLPDTDLKTSKIDEMYGYHQHIKGLNKTQKGFINVISFCMGIVTYIVGHIVKHILHPLNARLLGLIYRKKIDRDHRGFTHSVQVVLLNCVTLLAVTLLVMKVMGVWGVIVLTNEYYWYPVCFVAGIFCGSILHLIEDSCCVSGVQFFHPVQDTKSDAGKTVYGTVRTGNENERRPGRFAWVLVTSYFATFGILVVSSFILDGDTTLNAMINSIPVLFVTSITSVMVAWLLIFVWAGVRVSKEKRVIH
jgi:membrane-bound metal-dependent hydrolase YbcI (DUF457 family)